MRFHAPRTSPYVSFEYISLFKFKKKDQVHYRKFVDVAIPIPRLLVPIIVILIRILYYLKILVLTSHT
jgi:hypothetical protein